MRNYTIFSCFSSYQLSAHRHCAFSQALCFIVATAFLYLFCVGLSLRSCLLWVQRFILFTRGHLLFSCLALTHNNFFLVQMTHLRCVHSVPPHFTGTVFILYLMTRCQTIPLFFPVSSCVSSFFFTHIYLNILYLFYLLLHCCPCTASIISSL